MIRKLSTLLLTSVLFIFCADNTEPDDQNPFPELEIIPYADLERVIRDDSFLLAQPMYITGLGDQGVLVYDGGLGQYIHFDYEGSKLKEFGTTGRGPGEYDQFSGLRDLELVNNLFLGVDWNKFLINKYTSEWEFLESTAVRDSMRYHDIDFINESSMLQATHGLEGALAVVREIDGQKILQRVGDVQGKAVEAMGIEELRLKYAEGEIPREQQHAALVHFIDGHYLLFMKALGELRIYDEEGAILRRSRLPDSLLSPLKDYVIQTNKDGRPMRVMNLNYATAMKVFDDTIYLFTADSDPDGNLFHTNFITADLNGSFTRYMQIENPDGSSYFSDFTVSPEGHLILVDYAGSRLLKLTNF